MAHDGIKELRRRVYLLLEQGAIGDDIEPLGRPRAGRAHRAQSGGGGAAIGALVRRALRARLRRHRICLARGLLPRIRIPPVERGRARSAPPSASNARAPEICLEPGRRYRSRRGAAVLVRLRAAGRPARAAGVPHGALLQDRALFAGHALAARRALSRATRAVRLPDHRARYRAGRRRADASRRGQGAARQARHHSRMRCGGRSSPSAPSAMATWCRSR